jgi:hypothetical protein
MRTIEMTMPKPPPLKIIGIVAAVLFVLFPFVPFMGRITGGKWGLVFFRVTL